MDLLLSRYANIDYVMNLEIDDFVGIIKCAMEKESDERLYQMWLAIYPNMDKDTFISFNEFKDKALGKKTKEEQMDELRSGFQKQIERENKKSDNEVLSDADNILQMLSNNGYDIKE